MFVAVVGVRCVAKLLYRSLNGGTGYSYPFFVKSSVLGRGDVA